jgi:hypothetical protein
MRRHLIHERRGLGRRDLLLGLTSIAVAAPAATRGPGLALAGTSGTNRSLTTHYRTNLPLYPKVQAYFREHKPPTLIAWGKNDKIFLHTRHTPSSATSPMSNFISSAPATSRSRTRPTRWSR